MNNNEQWFVIRRNGEKILIINFKSNFSRISLIKNFCNEYKITFKMFILAGFRVMKGKITDDSKFRIS